MTDKRKINREDHKSWKPYHEAKDLIDATHKLVRVNANCKIMKIDGLKIDSGGNKKKSLLKIYVADKGNSLCNMYIQF